MKSWIDEECERIDAEIRLIQFGIFALFFYFFMTIVTFGYVYNHPEPCDTKRLISDCSMQRDQGAFGWAVFWPFYWSVQALKPDNLEKK